MPTYEYVCTSCGEHLEVVQSFRDDPLDTCPVCGGPLRKVFGSIGVVFKGSGFYKTDSRGGGKPAAAKDGEAKPAAPAKDGEAKPAAEKTGTKETAKSSNSGSEGSSSGPSSPKTTPTSSSAAAAAS